MSNGLENDCSVEAGGFERPTDVLQSRGWNEIVLQSKMRSSSQDLGHVEVSSQQGQGDGNRDIGMANHCRASFANVPRS